MSNLDLIEPGITDDFPENWSDFEITVGSLLSLSGFEVAAELILGSKRIDMLASIPYFGKTRRYAVECKCHEKRISRDILVRIETDYSSLRESNLIDELLLVTSKGMTPSALARVNESRFISHQTLDELRFSIIDFRSYLNDLQVTYKEEGLHRYYVPLQGSASDKSEDLEKYCLDWLSNKKAPPLALLGGYGSGKTTFLTHMANMLVALFKSEKSTRIPIYIPLHELCSEQSVEGLLGRHFTGLHSVPRYSFGTFRHLNNLGTFIFLLDGFDEMKHSMTTSEFRYTFQEVLRLITPRTKAILSGRLTAFLTDDERQEFLHATLSKKGRIIRMYSRPQFAEINLSPFSESQIEEFVKKYQRYVLSRPNRDKSIRLPNTDEFLQSENIKELASRPIQLRMLFEILPSYQNNLDQLSVKELYAFFVDLMLDREVKKPARRRFSAKHRKSFHNCLAFYMWERKISSTSIDDVPYECVPGNVEYEEMHDAIRDLISGSFLEIRYPAKVYFPHRSIQEFLVSEFILSFFLGKNSETRLLPILHNIPRFGYMEEHISPEIIDFMIASAGKKEILGGLKILSEERTRLSIKSLRFFLGSSLTVEEVINLAKRGSELALAVMLFNAKIKFSPISDEQNNDILKAAENLLLNSSSKKSCYRSFLMNLMLLSLEKRHDKRTEKLQQAFINLLSIEKRVQNANDKPSTSIQNSPKHIRDLVLLLRKNSNHRRNSQLISASDLKFIDLSKLTSTLVKAASGLFHIFGFVDSGLLRHAKLTWSAPLIDKIPTNGRMKELLTRKFEM